jgi:hypothetical protein
LFLAIATVVAGLGVPRAQADTPDGTTKEVTLQVDWDFTGGNVGPYHTAISHLRQAAGRIFRDDVYITQASEPGLIALRLGMGDGTYPLSLYLNPANLYIGGFRPSNGKLYAFNDASQNVRTEMARGGHVNILSFGGGYDSLIATAGREPTIENLDGFRGSIRSLAGVTDAEASKQGIAESMILFSGAFSEAARFTDFRDNWDAVIAGRQGGSFFEISNTSLRSLRESWGRLSKFAVDVTSNPMTDGIVIPDVRPPFFLWEDVRAHLRMIRR